MHIFCPLLRRFFWLVVSILLLSGVGGAIAQQTELRTLSPGVELTAAERAWLDRNHTVRVRVSDYPPYMLLKPELSGISVDYLSAVARRYGFKVEFLPDLIGFAAAVRDVAGPRQHFDLILTFTRTPEREKQFAITVDYLTAPWVVYARRDSPYIIGLESLGGKTVASEKGFVITNKIKSDYPAIRILEVAKSEDALLAVATGQADAYVGNLANSSYFIKANRLDNLVVTAPTPYGINTQAMAVRNDWPELAGLINKGIAAMTTEERGAISQKWGAVEFRPRTDYTLIWQILAASILILLAFLYWNRKLALEIARRKQAEMSVRESAAQLSAERDLLEQRVRERTATLGLSEARLRRAELAAKTGNWELRLDNQTIVASEGAARIYGLTADTIELKTIQSMTLDECRPNLDSALKALLEHDKPYDVEYKIRSGDGELKDLRSMAILDREQHVLFGVVQDITERKQLEVQLRDSQKMEALGTLAGGVAHDFNNALAAIIGNVELARQDVGPDHVALVSLDEIGKASRRAKDLVQQILTFGRRQKLERRPTSLALVVVESARLLRATFPAGVELKVDCKADVPAVLADATHVKQLLLNLCTNALHAVQDQGQPGLVEISLSAHSADGVPHNGPERRSIGERTPLREGRYACLSIRDNGPGMDEATRARIFEPFFTTKTVGKGTGLGLSVVHGIVKTHVARIEVESAPGQGSAFRIYFPATDAPAEEPEQSKSGGGPVDGAGKRVLYVDDEEAIIFLMKRLLERQGFRVSGYTDPHEALEAVRSNPYDFDLAVTDYNMPGLNGLEVSHALKQIRADLPVVLASGYITEELRANAPAAGVSELIYKPNTVDDLCEAVARYANAQTAGQASKPS